MNMYQVIVKRIGGVPLIIHLTTDALTAYQARNEAVSRYQRIGFTGKRNAAGVWRLSKREDGKRVRLAVYVQTVPTFSAN